MKPPAIPATPMSEDDDDLPLDDGDPNRIRKEYYDTVDLRRAGVPDDFIRRMRKTGQLPAVAKTASGVYLFESAQARYVIELYWRSRRIDRP